jgi:hypothetical protein
LEPDDQVEFLMKAEMLIRFCGKLGISEVETRQHESLASYDLIRDVPPGELGSLSSADLGALCDAFGPALFLSIGIPDAPPLLDVVEGKPALPLSEALADVARWSDTQALRLTLRIDKRSLLAAHGLPTDKEYGLYYLFEEGLLRLLRARVDRLDELLFADRYRPTLVIISEGQLRFEGVLLRIVGEDSVTSRGAISSGIRARIDKYHATAEDHLSWIGFRLLHITPLHLLCSGPRATDDTIGPILNDHVLTLCVLYTANRSSVSTRGFQASYASSERARTLTLEQNNGSVDAQLLPRLAVWPYGGGETDRLTILQNVVARELGSDDPRENAKLFTHRLEHLLDEARWHHRVFLDRRIGEHFEQVQKVIDYVRQVAGEISEGVHMMTKALADAFLGAIGVVIITLLASFLEGDNGQGMFVVVARVYAGYLAVQGLYRIGSLYHSFRLLRKDSREQVAAYAERLGRDRVSKLTLPIARREAQFRWWGIATVLLYVMLIVVIWNSGALLPSTAAP